MEKNQQSQSTRLKTWRFRLAAAASLAALSLAGCGSSDTPQAGLGAVSHAGNLLILNGDGTLASCAVNIEGTLGECRAGASSAVSLGSAKIATNGAHAYLTNLATNSVLVCTLDPANPQENCVSYAGDGVLSQPLGIAVSDSYAYIVNDNNTVAKCSVGQAGALSACKAQDGGGAFNLPSGVAVAGQYAYVSNQGNDTVAVCKRASDGSLTNCATSGSALSAPTSIAVSGNYAYITNSANNTLAACSLGSDGSLQGCAQTDGDAQFNLPSSVTVNGHVAYVTNFGDDTVTTCSVAGTTVSACHAGSAGSILFQTTGSSFVAVKS